MFYQIIFSPQVKRCAIISYKDDMYDLPQELPNNITFIILGNYETLFHRMIAQHPVPPTKIKTPLILAKKSRKIAIKLFSRYTISHQK